MMMMMMDDVGDVDLQRRVVMLEKQNSELERLVELNANEDECMAKLKANLDLSLVQSQELFNLEKSLLAAVSDHPDPVKAEEDSQAESGNGDSVVAASIARLRVAVQHVTSALNVNADGGSSASSVDSKDARIIRLSQEVAAAKAATKFATTALRAGTREWTEKQLYHKTEVEQLRHDLEETTHQRDEKEVHITRLQRNVESLAKHAADIESRIKKGDKSRGGGGDGDDGVNATYGLLLENQELMGTIEHLCNERLANVSHHATLSVIVSAEREMLRNDNLLLSDTVVEQQRRIDELKADNIELMAVMRDLQQELHKEIGISTVTRIHLQDERRAHALTYSEAKDTIHHLRADLGGEIDHLNERLEQQVVMHSKEIEAERRLMSIEMMELQHDLDTITQQLAEAREAGAYSSATRDAAARRKHLKRVVAMSDMASMTEEQRQEQLDRRAQDGHGNETESERESALATPSSSLSHSGSGKKKDRLQYLMDHIDTSALDGDHENQLTQEVDYLRSELAMANQRIEFQDSEILSLEASIEELEEDLHKEIGCSTVAKIHLQAERRALVICRNELRDSTKHMQWYYRSLLVDRRGASNGGERDLAHKLESEMSQFEVKEREMTLRIESLVAELNDSQEELEYSNNSLREADRVADELQALVDNLREQMRLDKAFMLSERHAFERSEARLVDDAREVQESLQNRLDKVTDKLKVVRAEFNRAKIERDRKRDKRLLSILQDTKELRAQLMAMRDAQIQNTSAMNLALEEGIHETAFAGGRMAENMVEAEREIQLAKQKRIQDEHNRAQGVLNGALESVRDSLQVQISKVGALTSETNRLSDELRKTHDQVSELEMGEANLQANLSDLAFLADHNQQQKETVEHSLKDRSSELEQLRAELEQLIKKHEETEDMLAVRDTELGELSFLVETLHKSEQKAVYESKEAVQECSKVTGELKTTSDTLRKTDTALTAARRLTKECVIQLNNVNKRLRGRSKREDRGFLDLQQARDDMNDTQLLVEVTKQGKRINRQVLSLSGALVDAERTTDEMRSSMVTSEEMVDRLMEEVCRLGEVEMKLRHFSFMSEKHRRGASRDGDDDNDDDDDDDNNNNNNGGNADAGVNASRSRGSLKRHGSRNSSRHSRRGLNSGR